MKAMMRPEWTQVIHKAMPNRVYVRPNGPMPGWEGPMSSLKKLIHIPNCIYMSNLRHDKPLPARSEIACAWPEEKRLLDLREPIQ